jgi:hypothetical protein
VRALRLANTGVPWRPHCEHGHIKSRSKRSAMNCCADIIEIVIVLCAFTLVSAGYVWIVRVITHYLRCPYA